MRFLSGHISKYNLKLKKNVPVSQINKDYDGKINTKIIMMR